MDFRQNVSKRKHLLARPGPITCGRNPRLHNNQTPVYTGLSHSPPGWGEIQFTADGDAGVATAVVRFSLSLSLSLFRSLSLSRSFFHSLALALSLALSLSIDIVCYAFAASEQEVVDRGGGGRRCTQFTTPPAPR